MDVDSSTIETHLALGGLYRKRGEFDKAILIHQNLLSRPTLESELKNQALYELARDFYSAGLYDRSEKIFNSLSEIKNYKNSCLEQLLKIYEVTKDWEKAINLIKSVNYSKMNKQNTELLLSQYYCEISKNYIQENQLEKAIAISKKALKKIEKFETLGELDFTHVIIPDYNVRLLQLAPLLPYYDIDPDKING